MALSRNCHTKSLRPCAAIYAAIQDDLYVRTAAVTSGAEILPGFGTLG
jgi:hypothetical protein